MKKVKFHFKLTSQGSLINVFFYPEEETSSIVIESDTGKEWESKDFELLVENPFDYKLKVFGVSDTEWEAELKIITSDGEKDFLKWEGKTGDTKRNISVRTKPIKNID